MFYRLAAAVLFAFIASAMGCSSPPSPVDDGAQKSEEKTPPGAADPRAEWSEQRRALEAQFDDFIAEPQALAEAGTKGAHALEPMAQQKTEQQQRLEAELHQFATAQGAGDEEIWAWAEFRAAQTYLHFGCALHQIPVPDGLEKQARKQFEDSLTSFVYPLFREAVVRSASVVEMDIEPWSDDAEFLVSKFGAVVSEVEGVPDYADLRCEQTARLWHGQALGEQERIESCRGGDAKSCLVVADGDERQRKEFLSLACAHDRASCIRAADILVDAGDPHGARQLLESGCDAGDADTCAQLIGFYDDALSREYAELCRADDALACLKYARSLRARESRVETWCRKKNPQPLYTGEVEKSCLDDENWRACWTLGATLLDQRRPLYEFDESRGDKQRISTTAASPQSSPSTDTDVLGDKCDDGDVTACYELGVKLLDDGATDAAHLPLDKACFLGEPRGCIAMAEASMERHGDKYRSEIIQVLTEYCTPERTETCQGLIAFFEDYGDHEVYRNCAAHYRLMSCRTGDAAACELVSFGAQ